MTEKPIAPVTITGTDWDGNPVDRTLHPGFTICLRGEFGKRFDIRGPAAWMCKECGHVLQSDGPIYPVTVQEHYSTAHGYTPALLP